MSCSRLSHFNKPDLLQMWQLANAKVGLADGTKLRGNRDYLWACNPALYSMLGEDMAALDGTFSVFLPPLISATGLSVVLDFLFPGTGSARQTLAEVPCSLDSSVDMFFKAALDTLVAGDFLGYQGKLLMK